MEKPIDYNQLFKQIVGEIKEGDKPTLFLHACCGPCLTYPLSVLVKYFKVTVGFFNPNIFPQSEYQKRLDTLKTFITEYSRDQGLIIPLVVNEDDFLTYREAFRERINDHEGGNTCLKCHAYRMGLAYQYAFEHKYDFFTTVMTVSCKKPSRELNEIAFKLAEKYPETQYLYSDFKKESGQLKGIQIAKNYQLYRQDYCGCEPSYLERQKQKAAKISLKTPVIS
ncbi:MAG: epoxyqueuosine reductase QueH [Bacilli bacterium]